MNWEKGIRNLFPTIQGKRERKIKDLRLGKSQIIIFQDKRELNRDRGIMPL